MNAPEARIQQVKKACFDYRDILVHGQPRLDAIQSRHGLGSLSAQQAQKIPKDRIRTCPWCRFRAARGTAFRTFDVQERGIFQRDCAAVGHQVVGICGWKTQKEISNDFAGVSSRAVRLLIIGHASNWPTAVLSPWIVADSPLLSEGIKNLDPIAGYSPRIRCRRFANVSSFPGTSHSTSDVVF